MAAMLSISPLHSCCKALPCASSLYRWLWVRGTAGKAPDKLAATVTLLDTHVGFNVK